jgi:hypothetical protein
MTTDEMVGSFDDIPLGFKDGNGYMLYATLAEPL